MASTDKRAVGIFPSRTQTASALQALSDSGFDLGDVSIIAQDASRQSHIAGVTVKDEITNQADTGGAVGAATGGLLGGVTGLLVGLGTLTIPGLGPTILAGEAAVILSTVIGGAAGAAAGGLVGALIGLGIPEHRAKQYHDRVAQGGYLVMVKGTERDLARAEQSLRAAGVENWGVYAAADASPRVQPMGRPAAIAAPGHLGPDNLKSLEDVRDRRRNFREFYDGSGDEPQRPLRGEYQPASDRAYAQQDDRVDRDRPQPYDREVSVDRDRPYGQDDRVDRDRPYEQQEEHYQATGLPHSSNPLQVVGVAADQSAPQPDLSRTDPPKTVDGEQRLVGVFLSRQQMEEALAQLRQTNFAMHTLSMAVRETEPVDQQRRNQGGHSLAGATRLAAGLDRVVLPEIGTLLVMGPDAGAFANTFSGDRDRSEAMPRNRADSLGIAPESVHLYRRHLTDGAYIVTLRGHSQELLQASSTLGKWGMRDWGIYDVYYR
ncbi:general stress protein [Nodosilinea nodulosa]|uniref:general stress protein n=1 Tax=Nodosilinea nodulosa TaxID=416001 RepID=UPI0002DEE4B4|nr:general stress protein [Nodosilinea nodulosa]